MSCNITENIGDKALKSSPVSRRMATVGLILPVVVCCGFGFAARTARSATTLEGFGFRRRLIVDSARGAQSPPPLEYMSNRC